MDSTPTRPDTRSWRLWHRQRLNAHWPAGLSFARPPLTSIIKVSFRPPRPLGIPWLRRRGMSLDAVPRVRVETPAPPVLGKETAGIRLLVSFLGFAESNIIGLTGLCKSSWPAANAYSDRQIRPTDYGSADFDHGPL